MKKEEKHERFEIVAIRFFLSWVPLAFCVTACKLQRDEILL